MDLRRLLLAALLTLVVSVPLCAQTGPATNGPGSAIPVRCVNTAGTAFEACGGSGGSVGADVNLASVGGNAVTTTVPVSGTVTFANTTLPVTNAGTFAVQAAQSGTWNIGTLTTITNPVGVTGTFWQATQPVSNAGTFAVQATLAAETTKVIGTVNIAAAQSIAITAASLPLPSLAATSTKQSDGSQKTQIVDGSGNVIGATANALDINIKSGNPTTITATQGTGTNLHTVVDSAPTTAVTNAGLTNLDVALSTRTKPADQQHAILDSGTTAVTQGTAANLNMTEASAAAIKADVDKIPSQGQALASGSTPVVLTAAQVSTLTPPTNTGYALDSSVTTLNAKDFSTAALQTALNTLIAAIQGTLGATGPAKANVTAGLDAQGLTRAILTDASGVPFVRPLPLSTFPLPPCNPVRRLNCSK